MDNTETAEKGTQERLIDTLLDRWEAHGGRGASARQVAGAAGVPVSSLYYHFESMEHLSAAAQAEARQSALAWCDAQLDCFAGAATGPEGFAGLFATLIDDWAQERRLAFAWREGQTLGATSEAARVGVQAWRTQWEGFWRSVSEQFELAPFARLTSRVFERKSLFHMLPWRPAVDRAALDEFSRGWVAWLTGAPQPSVPWHDYAQAEALRAAPLATNYDEVSTHIAEAAADLMSSLGAARLTHRAVAAACGLTLGVVSHRFRTRADLVLGAFSMLVRRIMKPISNEELFKPAEDRNVAIDGLVRLVVYSAGPLGFEELVLATARDPSLGSLAGRLRYLGGDAPRAMLQSIVGKKRKVSFLEGLLFTSVISGQARAYAERPVPEELELIRADFELLLDRIA